MAEFLREVDCSNCTALCCRTGMKLPLSRSEAATVAHTTRITELVPPQDAEQRPLRFLPLVKVTTPAKDGVYRLEEDCGYLQANQTTGQPECNAYNNSERPSVCGDFEVGSLACLQLRLNAGIDAPEQFALALERTAGS